QTRALLAQVREHLEGPQGAAGADAQAVPQAVHRAVLIDLVHAVGQEVDRALATAEPRAKRYAAAVPGGDGATAGAGAGEASNTSAPSHLHALWQAQLERVQLLHDARA